MANWLDSAAGQSDLHQIAGSELATALAELDMGAVLAECIPGTVFVALDPQSLAHGNSSSSYRERRSLLTSTNVIHVGSFATKRSEKHKESPCGRALGE